MIGGLIMTEQNKLRNSGLTDEQKDDLMGIRRKHFMEQFAISLEGDNDGIMDDIVGEIKKKRSDERWQVFKNEQHRKQLYFANRDSLIKEGIEDENREPGFRPRAFWEYEAKLEAKDLINTKVQHEYLIKNNLLYNGERDSLIVKWIQELEESKPFLRGAFEDYKEGHKRPLLNFLEWPEQAEEFRKEAEFYGGKAIQVWEEFLKEIEVESEQENET